MASRQRQLRGCLGPAGVQECSMVVTVRRARPGDIEAIAELALAAFDGYVTRIGRRPAPMDSDYGRAVDDDIVWVAEDSRDMSSSP
jgi:hypothetical protein